MYPLFQFIMTMPCEECQSNKYRSMKLWYVVKVLAMTQILVCRINIVYRCKFWWIRIKLYYDVKGRMTWIFVLHSDNDIHRHYLQTRFFVAFWPFGVFSQLNRALLTSLHLNAERQVFSFDKRISIVLTRAIENCTKGAWRCVLVYPLRK